MVHFIKKVFQVGMLGAVMMSASTSFAMQPTFGQRIKSGAASVARALKSPYFYKPAAVVAATAAVVVYGKKIPKIPLYGSLIAGVFGTAVMRNNGIAHSYDKKGNDIIADAEELLRAASGHPADQMGRDQYDFCSWHLDEYPNADSMAKQKQEIWNKLKADFPEDMYEAYKGDEKAFATFLVSKIDALKQKLEKIRFDLKTCLQTYRLNPSAWIQAWKMRPGVEEHWQARCGNKPFGYAADEDVRYMMAYCQDSWSDVITHPAKAFKRWILYPREGRASTAYWNLLLHSDRLSVLRGICASHQVKPNSNS